VAEQVADELIKLGYRAFALAGGISAWVTAKLPTDRKPAPQTAAPAPGSLKS
jgi:rhodanese-related sulfurtransferase